MKNTLLFILATFFSFVSNSQCADSLFVTGHTINAGVDGVSYQWYKDCSVMAGGMTVIPGATNKTYTPTDFTTDYAVMIIDSAIACTSLSSCVMIDTNCRAYFYPTQTTPGQVILVDSSYGAGTAMNYTWNFGDGTVAYTQYPTHNYVSPGSYQISLFIYDSLSGCSNFYHDTITVDSSGILRSGFNLTVISHNSVGFKEIDSRIDFNLFPNPANERVTITFSDLQSEGTIDLFNLSGKLISSKSMNGLRNYSIETQDFAPGVYLIRVSNQIGETTKRIIVE